MAAVRTFPQTEVRLSEVARGCPRMSVYRALGEQPSEPTSEQREFFARGHLFERYVIEQLRAKHGIEAIQPNWRVVHPLGVGHADALVGPERLLVEVKSTVSPAPSSSVFENAVNQLKLYLHYSAEVADSGAVYMINPGTLKPADVYEVRLSDDDREEIAEQMTALARAIEARELPDRVCSRPSQAIGRFCPFAGPCFAGWEETPDALLDDPDALSAVSELAAIKANLRAAKESVKALEQAKDDAQRQVEGFVQVGTTTVGPYSVKRWEVSGRKQFSIPAALAAGFTRDELEPFISEGSGHTRVEVAAATEAGDVDFGEVPF